MATAASATAQGVLPDPLPGAATSAGYYYENLGQIIDENGTPWPSIKYYSEKGRARLFFADDKVYHTLRKAGDSVGGTLAPDTAVRLDVRFDCAQWRENGQYCGSLVTYEQSPDFLNYFLPHCGTAGITNVVGWKTVMYQNAFPGIDVRYTANASGPVMYFVIHPGANPADIRLVMDGQDSLLQYVGGSLRAALGQQSVLFPTGTVYQIDALGNPYAVPSWFATWYEINDSTVSLNTGAYNSTDELIIKVAGPPVLTSTTAAGQDWGTYYDGDGNYIANAANIAVERYDLNTPASTAPPAGEVGLFSAQEQNTNNFQALNGLYTINNGLADVYLSKFNGAYVRQWATYYGAWGNDVPTGIALDSGKTGGFYIIGHSHYLNTNLTIPSPNAGVFYQSQGPAFIGKFNKLNGHPTWISKIDGNCIPEAVDIDFADDRLYVVGNAGGWGGTAFPTPLAGYFPIGNNSGNSSRYVQPGGTTTCGFVMEFATSNNALIWSTMVGNGNRLLAVKKWNSHNGKRLWVGGVTDNAQTDPNYFTSPLSGSTILPAGVAALANPLSTTDYFQSALATDPAFQNQNLEGYLAAFDDSMQIEWATYFGGDRNDVIRSLALAPNGDLLVAGTTQTVNTAPQGQAANNVGKFPAYQNPLTADYFSAHSAVGGGDPTKTDDFLARFSPSYQLLWSTYFGTGGHEGGGPSTFLDLAPGGPAIATDALGYTFVGSTTQKPAAIPGTIANLPALSLGTLYFQQNHSSTADSLPAKDCYFAMFGPVNEQKWTTHFGGNAGPGLNSMGNPNPSSSARADEIMSDIAVLSGHRLYGFLTTHSAITPTQQPPTSPTVTPYFDHSLGGANGDPFLTAFKYSQYATTAIAQQPGKGAKAFGLTVFPNPASDKVRVEFSLPAASAATLTLSDATGRIVTSRSLKGSEGLNRTTVDLKGTSAGLYLLQLTTNTGHEAIKIVKR